MGILSEATVAFGQTTLIESDPGEETCREAIYAPFRPDLFFDRDPAWGIYDRRGRLVQAAGYYRGPHKKLVGQSETTPLANTDLPVVDEAFVYGGPVILHYGHFLTAALPRFWHLCRPGGKRLRILCHGHEDPKRWFEKDYVRGTLGAIGLSADDFVRFEQACVVRRLWVPRPSMEEQYFIHRAFDHLAVAIGRAHDVHQQTRGTRPVYLSKTKLRTGITRFAQEQELEDHLAARGFEIAHPQEISFAAQIQLLARAPAIAGTLGSGLHTSLFLDRPARIVALTGLNLINSNYLLIDRLKRHDSHYLYPTSPAISGPKEPGFDSNAWIEDMAAVARAYADHF